MPTYDESSRPPPFFAEAPPSDLEPLRTHELGEALARGGMGVVHQAHDRVLKRDVAVKILRPELQSDPAVVARFLHEARLAAMLEHPHVVPVHAVGRRDDLGPFFTMKLVDGETLFDRLRRDRSPMRGERLDGLLDVLVRVCDALSMAHAHGVVHGDIKSKNVMLGTYGQVYLTDWGNARQAGQAAPRGPDGQPLVLGTLGVLAPEQARGDVVDARTDVFGMGALLYTILGRRVPYARGGPPARIAAAREGRFTPIDQLNPRAPEPLVEVCQRAMALSPDDRHADILAFRRDIDAYRRGQIAAPARPFRAGQVLMREGDPSDHLIIVEEGRLRVWCDVRGEVLELGTFGPGAIIGEVGVLAGSPRTATVEARTDGRLLHISVDRLEAELVRMPGWVRTLIESLAERLVARTRS